MGRLNLEIVVKAVADSNGGVDIDVVVEGVGTCEVAAAILEQAAEDVRKGRGEIK